MQTQMPFYESPEEALKACVSALGGAKAVGSRMFPDKTIDNARDYLLACLNAERPEKLHLSQLIFIFAEAKKIGFDAGFQYFAGECHYEATPINEQDENAKLQRQFVDAVGLLNTLQAKLQANGVLKAVA